MEGEIITAVKKELDIELLRKARGFILPKPKVAV